jgi:DNA-binding beta-propeller fold protein YncE
VLPACGEKFELPPVPEAQLPRAGAYNVETTWEDFGQAIDMVLWGSVLYVIVDQDGERTVDAYLPKNTSATRVPEPFRGRYDGLRTPTAIAAGQFRTETYLYVADQRGPEALARRQDCGSGLAGCSLGLETHAGGADRELLGRSIPGMSGDFTLTFGCRIDGLPDDGWAETVIGTQGGRKAVWLRVLPGQKLTAIRSDPGLPDTLNFEFGRWHAVEIRYASADREYAVRVDGELLDIDTPVFHPINAPIDALSLRFVGEAVSGGLDELLATRPAEGDTTVFLRFEDAIEIDDGWGLGPYFTNDPAPAVLRYVARDRGGPIQAYSSPDWHWIGGIAVDPALTLYVSVQRRDPSDIGGVATQGAIDRFEREGAPMAPLSEPGTGLGFVQRPRGLHFDRFDSTLLVVDESLHRAQKLDVATPNHALFQIPPLDAPEALFSGPRDVVADQDSHIYVADTQNHRILRFTSTGALADTVYSLTFTPEEQIFQPSAIAADTAEVWVSDTDGRRIVVLRRAADISGGGP